MSLKSFACVLAGLLAGGLAEAKPLRVLCYNLRYITSGDQGERAWTARRDQAAELIQDDAADIVGIQEGLPQMMDDLADRLDEYAVIGVGREDGVDQGEYAAILVKADRFRVQESGTFYEFTGVTSRARIDVVYATPDLKVIDAAIVRSSLNGNYPSDHFPVRATLQW